MTTAELGLIIAGVAAVATVFYVWYTRWIAQSTAQVADAARESAQVARDALLAEHRPELVLDESSMPETSGSPRRLFTVTVRNHGPGPARNPCLFAEVTAKGGRARGDVFNEPPETIIEAGMHPVKYQFRVSDALSNERARERLLIVCHYEDLPPARASPRVYHSVYEGRPGGRNKKLYFPPSLPAPEEYLRLCDVCRGGDT